MISCGICFSLPDLLQLVWQFLCPSMLLQMALFYSFFMAEYYSIVYMYHSLFIHSSVNGYLGYCYVLAPVNSVAFGVHVSFQIRVFSRFMPRNGISGSYDSCSFSF